MNHFKTLTDGIDEIQNFKEHWNKENMVRKLSDLVEPIEWCFALMRRQCLEKLTVIISSR